MKFEMNPNSLFAILMRGQWWTSALIVVGIIVFSRFVLPPAWFMYGAFAAMPFLVITGITLWNQAQLPSAGRVQETVEAVRVMPWVDFANALEAGFRREGFTVARDGKSPVDFEMVKGYRTAVVGAKRWKAARLGVEPLRELLQAKETREAHECIYVSAGEVSDNARAFAKENRIRIVADMELAKLVTLAEVRAKAA